MSSSANHLESQSAAAYGDWIASIEVSKLNSTLQSQSEGYQKAIEEINKLRQIIGTPEHILGNPKTKHGEIAEFLEVYSRRAHSRVNLTNPEAIIGINRNGPVDYMIGDTPYQSKFINGENNTLFHTLDHIKDYINQRPDLKYHIAKDHYNVIKQINNGNTENLSLNSRSINAIKRKVKAIEEATDRSFSKVVEPSNAKYSEVQQGKIHDTINKREESIEGINKRRKETINKEHGVSFGGFANATLIGFGIGFTTSLGKQALQDKSLEVLISKQAYKKALRGGGIGAASSGGAYLLMHGANIPGPVVAGIVTTAQGITKNVLAYRKDNINKAELRQNIAICSAEGVIITGGAYLGQVLIPIPVVGTMVGTAATQYTLGSTKKIYSNNKTNKLILNNLEKYQQELSKFTEERIKKQTKFAEYSRTQSNLSTNNFYSYDQRLKASINAHNTTKKIDEEPLKNTQDVDNFMSSPNESMAA